MDIEVGKNYYHKLVTLGVFRGLVAVYCAEVGLNYAIVAVLNSDGTLPEVNQANHVTKSSLVPYSELSKILYDC